MNCKVVHGAIERAKLGAGGFFSLLSFEVLPPILAQHMKLFLMPRDVHPLERRLPTPLEHAREQKVTAVILVLLQLCDRPVEVAAFVVAADVLRGVVVGERLALEGRAAGEGAGLEGVRAVGFMGGDL